MIPYKLVAYINGVRFYPSTVTYSAQEGGHATFAVQVPAVPEWHILPERSHCAVFYADPVSNSYRLLTEGEYIGDSRGKQATGSRYKALTFRSTHAVWGTVQYAGFVGLATGKDVTQEAQLIAASGKEIRAASSGKTASTGFDLARVDLIAFFKAVSTASATFGSFVPKLVEAVMQQSPVDAFYHAARKMRQKTFAFEDDKIGDIIDKELFIAILQNSWAAQNLGPGTTLETIISAVENFAMYQHTPIPSPPLLRLGTADGSEDVIAETLFTPHLYSVVPPACNVIFRDQISDISMSRNFMAEPTRVITQLQAPAELGGGLPLVFMSNDVERSVSVSQVLSNQTNTGCSAGTLSTHDLLTQEEYHRGVVPAIVNFPIQHLEKVREDLTPEQQSAARDRFSLYVQSACRHYYEVKRSEYRTANVNCSFLPYAVPGFPCLIEDESGSFFGIIQSVNHVLNASSQPVTSLAISHVREAYAVDGRLRNAMTPSWLNSRYLPLNINDTYSKLFGVNAGQPGSIAAAGSVKHAAMVPDVTTSGFGGTNPLNSTQNVNMDELAASVVPIPKYSTNGELLSVSTGTVADRVRLSADPALAALRFQYRAGTSLSQFLEFHGLATADDRTTGGANTQSIDYIFAPSPLPPDLSPGPAGVELFGTPSRLRFVGGTPGTYGVYELEAVDGETITSIRQRAARTIAAAIARRITSG